MMQRLLMMVLSAAILGLCGCSANTNSSPKPVADPSAGKTSPSFFPAVVDGPPGPEAAAAKPKSPSAAMPAEPSKPAPAPQHSTAAASPFAAEPHTSGAAGEPSISLSVGIALPQPTVDGTVMTFSVDYEFTHGGPGSSGQVWVIERARGAAAKKPVQLARDGNLAIVVKGWRPEDGPFHTYIEDQSGRKLSPRIELR
jgi:hypothetical protein